MVKAFFPFHSGLFQTPNFAAGLAAVAAAMVGASPSLVLGLFPRIHFTPEGGPGKRQFSLAFNR